MAAVKISAAGRGFSWRALYYRGIVELVLRPGGNRKVNAICKLELPTAVRNHGSEREHGS